jgi:hypothetical protein
MTRFPAPDLPPARMIHGIASSERVLSDEHQVNHAMLARGCPLHPVPLLRAHNGKAIGEVVYLRWIGTNCIAVRLSFIKRVENRLGERSYNTSCGRSRVLSSVTTTR